MTLAPSAGSAGLALAAAVLWGGGDFSGGMGVKAIGGTLRGALRLIVAAHSLSLLALLLCIALTHAGWPAETPLLWGLGAGVSGALGLVAFYIALSRGEMGAAAAVSGLLAAAVPAIVSSVLDGTPGPIRIVGFGIAAIAIWLIAATPASEPADRQTLGLAIIGGFGFGFYFVALRLANPAGVLEPTAMARVGSLVTCTLLLLTLGSAPAAKAPALQDVEAKVPSNPAARESAKKTFWLSGQAWLWAIGVALLDTGGNLFFIAATRQGRLDAAAVLASLYPASTILLAAWMLHERPARQQLFGMAVAMVAVVLVTL